MSSKSISFGPWTKGIVNTAAPFSMPKDGVLDALNVDFLNSGWVRSRSGFGPETPVDQGHSLCTAGRTTLMVFGEDLVVLDSISPLITTILRSGLTAMRHVSYAELAGEVWWSNGEESGRCNSDHTDSPWAVPTPASAPTLSPTLVGTLPAGSYRVAITHAMLDGEESAAKLAAVDLAAEGGITVTLPAAQSGVDKFVVYCSGPDGAVLQRYSTVTAATASVSISAPAEGRSVGNRALLATLPAGDTVAFFNGRLLSASGRVVSYSDTYNFGLYNPAKNWIMLPDEIRVVAPCENGVFIGTTSAVYWYAGADIAQAEVFERIRASSVRGTVFSHPNGKAVGWMSSDGMLIGTPDGAIASPMRANGFLPPVAEYGAAFVRQRGGETHVLFSLDTSARYPADVQDGFTAAREAYDDDQTMLCVNLNTGAASRYAWAFNSFAQIGRAAFGIDAGGLRELEGSDDDGSPIHCVVDLGKPSVSGQISTPINVYVYGESSDKLTLVVSTPSGPEFEYLSHKAATDAQCVRFQPGKGLRATYHGFRLTNGSYGSSFTLSALDALMSISQRRIGA